MDKETHQRYDTKQLSKPVVVNGGHSLWDSISSSTPTSHHIQQNLSPGPAWSCLFLPLASFIPLLFSPTGSSPGAPGSFPDAHSFLLSALTNLESCISWNMCPPHPPKLWKKAFVLLTWTQQEPEYRPDSLTWPLCAFISLCNKVRLILESQRSPA